MGLKGFRLQDVIIKDAYLQNAIDKDVEYLLSLDTDRLLAGFRETSGVDMRGAVRYDGWENMLIGGHTMGHYMTACVNAYNSPNVSAENKNKLYQILDNLLTGMDECQKKSRSGFLFGAVLVDKANVEKQFDNVEEGKTNIITEAWVPWYTMHKIIEGLVSVIERTKPTEDDWDIEKHGWKDEAAARLVLHDRAMVVATRLGNWVHDRVSTWSEDTRRRVLGIEYGGMNDVMYDLYLHTGAGNHFSAGEAFNQVELFEQVANASAEDNVLNNRHANTTIPKFMGALKRYVVTDDVTYLEYAKAFWDMVANNHSYITGGNSEWEHFGEDNVLDAERTNCNCETCNAYNMLKMTKLLFEITGDIKYADWYENTFLNSILSSQNPKTGMTTYFQPMASGYFKVYGEPYNRFWCCTGTGMENFTKLGESFYFTDKNLLIVNQYISSAVHWEEKKLTLHQMSEIPKTDKSTFVFEGDYEGSIALRIPEWIAGDVTITLNNTEIKCEIKTRLKEKTGNEAGITNQEEGKNGYAVIAGEFRDGDKLCISLPMEVRAFSLPDAVHTYGFKYGPVVLSALLGTCDMEYTVTGVDVLIPQKRIFDEKLLPSQSECVHLISGSVEDFMEHIADHMERYDITWEDGGKDIVFRLKDVKADLSFVTHYRQHQERYGIYFRYVDENTVCDEVSNEKATLIERCRLDTVQPGYGQYENDKLHQMQEIGTGSVGSTAQGTKRYAKSGGGFSYTMLVDLNRTSLMLTLSAADNGKGIRILAGNTLVYEKRLEYNDGAAYYDVMIPIPREVLLEQSWRKSVEGAERDVMTFTIQGIGEEASASLCDFAHTLAYMV